MSDRFKPTGLDILRMQSNSGFATGEWSDVPSANSSNRGMQFRTEGGNGVADTAGIVLKNATNAYVRKYHVLADAPADASSDVLYYPINGGGVVIATGLQRLPLIVPFACTITKWTLLADVSGSIVVDIWKDTYANYPPLVADSITASAKPTITTATKAQSSSLTGWTTSLAAEDILYYNVDSIATITWCAVALSVTRSA